MILGEGTIGITEHSIIAWAPLKIVTIALKKSLTVGSQCAYSPFGIYYNSHQPTSFWRCGQELGEPISLIQQRPTWTWIAVQSYIIIPSSKILHIHPTWDTSTHILHHLYGLTAHPADSQGASAWYSICHLINTQVLFITVLSRFAVDFSRSFFPCLHASSVEVAPAAVWVR